MKTELINDDPINYIFTYNLILTILNNLTSRPINKPRS